MKSMINTSYPGAYLRGGGPCACPPPFEAGKNFEKSKINRKCKERRPSDIVYFRSTDVRMVAAVYFALQGGGG